MTPVSPRFTLLAAAALSLAFPQFSEAAGRMKEVEPNNDTVTAIPLQFDANRLTKVSGNIFPAGDVDDPFRWLGSLGGEGSPPPASRRSTAPWSLRSSSIRTIT